MGLVSLPLVLLLLLIILLQGLRRVLLGRTSGMAENLREPLEEQVMCHSDSWVKKKAIATKVGRDASFWEMSMRVGVYRFWREVRMSLRLGICRVGQVLRDVLLGSIWMHGD